MELFLIIFYFIIDQMLEYRLTFKVYMLQCVCKYVCVFSFSLIFDSVAD